METPGDPWRRLGPQIKNQWSPMEQAGRGSSSKDNGPLELGAPNQESMGLIRIPWPLELDGDPYQEPIGP